MKKNQIPSFIQKTWDILQKQLHNDVIRWRNQGNSFEIADESRFRDEVLPLYFKHSNISSFIRQLNMYNFHKRKTFEGSVEFYHKLFRRNQQQLLIGIKRKPSEADIQLGEELIRKLAPQIANQGKNEDRQSEEDIVEVPYKNEETSIRNEDLFRPVLGLVSWIDNIGQLNSWTMGKKIKTMVLKNPPENGMENTYL